MGGETIVPRAPPGYATVFTPDVISIHNVSRLLQFLLSGFILFHWCINTGNASFCYARKR